MLEDESGRVRLIGDRILKGAGVFVTGSLLLPRFLILLVTFLLFSILPLFSFLLSFIP